MPLSVSPPVVRVGVGGVGRIEGTCPAVDGVPLGPVQIAEIGREVRWTPTGITAAAWSFDWQAPTVVGPLTLQVWCGDPTSDTGGYPAGLVIASSSSPRNRRPL